MLRLCVLLCALFVGCGDDDGAIAEDLDAGDVDVDQVADLEVCDGVDNDGDGAIDDADDAYVPTPCALQLGVCAGSFQECSGGFSAPCGPFQYGGSFGDELAGDELDNDCDGDVDEAD